MNRTLPVHLILLLCCLGFFGIALIDRSSIAHASVNDSVESIYIFENGSLPKGMLDVIRTSRAKYIEGSGFIKSGDTEKARESYNKAVDLVLQSDWDLSSTPELNKFFQDLIQRIQEDESRYLQAPCETDEDAESAVVDELNDLELFPVSVDSSFQDSLAADVSKAKYEIPITMNEMVSKSLDYWLNSGRKYFVDGLLRSGQYRPIIERVFREESIPLDLMYLAQVESLFKPHAVSKAKAKGIWQFEKDTARAYGLKVTRDVDERSDPEKSTRAAARYLNDLFAMFKDWNLALAAYNWGEGKVQRLIDSTGMNDFWQLADLRRKLPQETKNHVPLIQASVILARNPEKFGLPTELDPPLKYAEVSVSKPIDLRAAAKILSTSIDELKKLNPALRGFTTPANYPNYQLKVPADSDPRIHDKLAELPMAKIRVVEDSECRHKVRRGDTLAKIAAKYHISVAEIAKENGFSSKKKLVPGTWIQLPSRTAAATKIAAKKSASASTKSAEAKSKSGKNSTKEASSAKNGKKTGSPNINSASIKNQLEPKSKKQIASN